MIAAAHNAILDDLAAGMRILEADSLRVAMRLREEMARADLAEAAGEDVVRALAYGLAREQQLEAEIRQLRGERDAALAELAARRWWRRR